jgi:hypothetical protein
VADPSPRVLPRAYEPEGQMPWPLTKSEIETMGARDVADCGLDIFAADDGMVS